jgi:hypothetical protein
VSYSNYLEQSPGSCILYTLIGIIIAIILLYFARTFAHRAIRNFHRVLRNAFRFAAFTILKGEERLSLRNREVLLSGGLEAVEHDIEREFHRVGTVVARDLQGYPSLNRKLSELIAKIDEDYLQSEEVPPTPPVWINAVEAVAKIPDKGSNIVRDILSDIHKTIIKIQKEAMVEYWKATNKRHALLSRMMPFWRKLSITLGDVDKTMNGLLERAKNIDKHMQDYEEIRQGTDKALRRLSSSSLTQFFIAGLGLFIAVGAATVNFHLVALPLSEMVGGSSYIAGFRVSDVAGLFVILLETLMGIFFMEAMRFTKLFPVIGSLDDKWRVRMAGITLGFLCIFAGIETSLAFMRDVIASGNQALVQSLTGTTETFGTGSKIPTVAQMVMGFVLPFALTLVAIPLESFVHAARTVLGIALQGTLRGIAALLRFLGSIFYHLGAFLVSLYDLLIFAPLWIEERIARGKTEPPAPAFTQEAVAMGSATEVEALVGTE